MHLCIQKCTLVQSSRREQRCICVYVYEWHACAYVCMYVCAYDRTVGRDACVTQPRIDAYIHTYVNMHTYRENGHACLEPTDLCDSRKLLDKRSTQIADKHWSLSNAYVTSVEKKSLTLTSFSSAQSWLLRYENVCVRIYIYVYVYTRRI